MTFDGKTTSALVREAADLIELFSRTTYPDLRAFAVELRLRAARIETARRKARGASRCAGYLRDLQDPRPGWL